MSHFLKNDNIENKKEYQNLLNLQDFKILPETLKFCPNLLLKSHNDSNSSIKELLMKIILKSYMHCPKFLKDFSVK